jgi:hypothetical protein
MNVSIKTISWTKIFDIFEFECKVSNKKKLKTKSKIK